MIELFSFLVDILNILLEFYLFFSSLKSIGEEKFTIKSSNLLAILEEFSVSLF